MPNEAPFRMTGRSFGTTTESRMRERRSTAEPKRGRQYFPTQEGASAASRAVGGGGGLKISVVA